MRPEDLDEEEEEAAADKARLCLAAGLQPSEYDRLTDIEREAFVTEINRRTT